MDGPIRRYPVKGADVFWGARGDLCRAFGLVKHVFEMPATVLNAERHTFELPETTRDVRGESRTWMLRLTGYWASWPRAGRLCNDGPPVSTFAMIGKAARTRSPPIRKGGYLRSCTIRGFGHRRASGPDRVYGAIHSCELMYVPFIPPKSM